MAHCDETGDPDQHDIKYILSTLYGLLFLAAAIILFLVRRARPAERCRVPLHAFVAMSALVRLIEQLIPFSAYCNIKDHALWLQVLLDLLPELLFWQTFVMLVLLWVEMYTFSRNKLNSNPASIWSRLSLLTIFFISSCVAYICSLLFSIVMQASGKYSMLAEAIFLTILTFTAMIVFMRYGYLTHKKLDKVPLFPAHRKTKRLNKLKFTVISVVICNLVHITYLYIVDVIDLSHDVHINGDTFLWVWMFYFIFTEIAPATAILVVFRKPPRRDPAGRSRNSQLSVNQYTPLTHTSIPSYADSYLPNPYASYASYSTIASSPPSLATPGSI
eukprot:Phypoly_transcript_11106.p1 GENE.Phypoly_transcript_11106~~Phypoly_transcript_11106.p1  ORF type:complete len:331 (+),score=26.01 Phypoly_transcript_11106:76-1068(+)